MRRDAGFIRSDRERRSAAATWILVAWILVMTLAACAVSATTADSQTTAPGATGAAAQHAGSTAEAVPFPGSGGIVLKLALSLGAVVVLILVLQRVARRYGGALGAGTASDRIRVISQRAVGPKLSLVLVQVMDRAILVGVSPQGIRRVADLGRVAQGAHPGVAPAEPAYYASGAERSPAAAWGGLRRLLRSRAASRRVAAIDPAGPVLEAATENPNHATAQTVSAMTESIRPADFEGELTRRLAALRSRYPSIRDLETEGEGGCA